LEIQYRETNEKFRQARMARESMEEIVDLYLETKRKLLEYKD
jgi:hypothetical protein